VSRLLLVRHGQSTWNALGRWQGQADPPLSPLGIEQAETAAKLLDRVDAVRSSDLERAHHTARILASAQGHEVSLDVRVRERDAGAWTGLTREEIDAQYPGYLEDGRRPPGYESDDDLVRRTVGALREFATNLVGGAGLVVTHGGVILSLERRHGLVRTPIHNLEARWLESVGAGPGMEFALGERVALL
jgi:broad specificity phosphatase PhoE